MDETPPPAGHRLRLFVITAAIAAVAIACAIGLVLAMGSLHERTVSADTTGVDEAVPAAPYRLDVRVKIVAVDLDNETVGLQLECIPQGADLFVPEGESGAGRLMYPITLALGVSRAGTQQKQVFAGWDKGSIVRVTLNLDGNVEDYPLDRHTTLLWLSATRQAKGLDPDPIPIRLTAYGAWPGQEIKLHAVASDWGTDGDPFSPRQLDVAITRSHATKLVVDFSIVLTWILIVSVLGMTVSVVFAGRKTEIAMLAYFGTLLFAMTAFRNSLPGAPPMGTFSDYLAFFWGYGVAIVAIGAVSIAWLWRRASHEQHRDTK